MNILFFHRWVGVHGGGTETHLKELVFRFKKRGHKISILTREGSELEDGLKNIKIFRVSKNLFESDHSYEDIRVYYHTFLFILKSFLKLVSLIKRGEKFDIISCHFVTEAKVANIIRKLFKIPYIFILEGYTPWEAKEAMKANTSIAISKYIQKRCQKEFNFKPHLIPVGIDLKKFTPPKSPKRYTLNPFVLTVSRLEPRKNIPLLLEAAKIVYQKNPKILFKIAGTGILEKEFKEKISAKGGSASGGKNVKLLGYVYEKDLFKLYQGASLFVLPSKEEAFGIVLLEAMASGLPIIATDVGGVSEVVENVGILVPKNNPEILAEKILEVLENDKLRKEMREKGLFKVREYNWENLIKKYEKIYQKTINEF